MMRKLFLDHLGTFGRRSALKAWERERTKYPSLRRTLTVSAKDLAAQHNDEAL